MSKEGRNRKQWLCYKREVSWMSVNPSQLYPWRAVHIAELQVDIAPSYSQNLSYFSVPPVLKLVMFLCSIWELKMYFNLNRSRVANCLLNIIVHYWLFSALTACVCKRLTWVTLMCLFVSCFSWKLADADNCIISKFRVTKPMNLNRIGAKSRICGVRFHPL